MARPRVVLDTNVIISGLLFGGHPADIVELAIDGAIEAITSVVLLQELDRVLSRKFAFSKREAKEAAEVIQEIAVVVSPVDRIDVVSDEPDNRVLEAAVAGRASYIVTGDKRHLLPLVEYQGIRIVTPSAFIAERPW